MLVNHVWSFAGDRNRDNVSSTFIQPGLYYTWGDGWTLGVDVESTYDSIAVARGEVDGARSDIYQQSDEVPGTAHQPQSWGSSVRCCTGGLSKRRNEFHSSAAVPEKRTMNGGLINSRKSVACDGTNSSA